MKKNILAGLALILALASLLLAGFTWLNARNQAENYATRLNELEAELQNLKSQISEMQSNVTEVPEEVEPYCNLYLSDWSCDGSTLTLTAAYAQVVTTASRPLTSAALILEINGIAHSTLVLDMHPGEASDSYELNLAGFPLTLPELTHGDHLELRLEATLSDGTILTAWAGGWDWENGQLLMIAG